MVVVMITTHQGSTPDVPFDQSLAGKLIIGVHDRCAIDAQLVGQRAFGRQTYTFGKFAG